MGYRSIDARRILSAIGISTILVIGLTASAVAEQARRARIAEDNAPRPADRVFFSYNYYANVAIEGGVSSGETSGGINNQRDPIGFEKTFLGGDVSFGMRVPFQLLDGGEQSLAFGVKFRSYFGNEGDPNQALTHYSRDWMFMPYVAMPIAFMKPGQPPGGKQFVISPFVGPIFEHGDLSIFNNQGRASVTRHGVGVGINFDVLFPTTGGVNPFIGFGGQISAMQAVNERIDGFDVRLEDTVEARAVVRGGFTFR
jgi:hypothetical protein